MPRSSNSLSAFMAPQIPLLSAEPPTGSGWIHEINHNGYRTLLRIDRGQAQALRDLCLAFHHCTLSYAILYEVALRLYEPRLREMAPEHLKAHADAALSTARLLPDVVAWQLVQEGLHCACICPMCGLGACGCVAYATETLIAAWRDAAPIESEPPGFVSKLPSREVSWRRLGCKAENFSSRLMVNRCAVSKRFRLRSANTRLGTW
jgi:hypothetical protein